MPGFSALAGWLSTICGSQRGDHGQENWRNVSCDPVNSNVGIHNGELLLDLDYAEDSTADADFNIVMTDAGDLVEIQGTAEGMPFPRQRVGEALSLAARGMETLFGAQRGAVG